jgi:acyl carrier protein
MGALIEELKKQIVEILNLEDIKPEDVDENAPLFGTGLGLDSIDALELVVMLEKHYGIKITNSEVARKAFYSVKTLADFIEENRDKCHEEK